MPRIPDEKINEIRQSVDIVDVIGAYLPLTKKGRNYVAVCPFHDDTNPSMSISQDKQIYMCFVCHHGGNVFSFVKDYLKISYIEAIKEVAKMGNVDISEYNIGSYQPKVDEKKEPLYKINDISLDTYTYYLNTRPGLRAKEYLTDRHIDDDVINYFQIGYAPTNNIITQLLQKEKYSNMEILKSGLVIESNNLFDRFSDRIMFPIHNSNGRTIGFSGRIYNNKQQGSKYMNSPESDIFIKGDTLYNYHRIKDDVRHNGNVIVCEGFMDVIALYKVGIKNVVAIMGTAFTTGHINLLKRLTRNVVMCLDGDSAGQNATLKCIETLESNDFNVHVAKLPEGSDPDEVLNDKGNDELRAIVNKPVSVLEFKLDYYYNQSNMANYEDKKAYLERMVAILSTIEDAIDLEYYINVLSTRSGFDKSMIYSLINKKQSEVTKQKNVVTYQHDYNNVKKVINKYQKAERGLLFYMMKDKKYADVFKKELQFMNDHSNELIAKYIIDYYYNNPKLDLAGFIDTIKNDSLISEIMSIANEKLPDQTTDSIISDYIKQIKEKVYQNRVDELRKEMESTVDPLTKAKIAAEIIELENKE